MTAISIALLCSYLFFVALRALIDRFQIQTPSLSLLRCSQALIVISIAFPFALSLVPQEKLPRIEFHSFTAQSKELPVAEQADLKPIQIVPPQASFMDRINQLARQIPVSFAWFVWCIGVAFVGTRHLLSFLRLRRLLKNSTSMKKIGSVTIAVSESVTVPFSVRFFLTKWVVIPLAMLENRKDFRLALKHELQHHRQGDTLWATGTEVLQCLFYFHPAFYGWKNIITELQEFSCDEALTGQRRVSKHEYGSCLVRVAETALESREVYAGTTCMAATSGNSKVLQSLLTRRIKMIMQDQRSAKKWVGSLIGIIAGISTIAVAYSTEQFGRSKSLLAIDSSIQKIADQILAQTLKKQGAKMGMAIVADPNTGAILAVANIDHQKKRNGMWALDEKLEPASFLKAIVAADAINDGITTPEAEHGCENGNYPYQGKTYHDWKKGGWEKLSTTEAIAWSSDVCTFKIAEKMGEQKLKNLFEKFGFGSPEAGTQIILASAYGMGFKTTPLEILRAFGAIANGGNLVTPQQAPRRVLSEDAAQKAREMLRQVVLIGTGKPAASKLYTTAGKTASSFTGGVMESESTGGNTPSNLAGFVGFAPAKNPKVEIYVVVYSPNDPSGAHGSTHAAPIFRDIADAVLQHMKVPSDL